MLDWKPLLSGGLLTIYTNGANGQKKDVTVKILVSVFGLARGVSIVDDLSDNVREEVLQAAQKARFRPAIKNGQPIAYWSNVTIQTKTK
jgi:TonB-like protein